MFAVKSISTTNSVDNSRLFNEGLLGSNVNKSKTEIKTLKSSPSIINVCGVEVHFPFEPYYCQRIYMEKVMNALHQSENALLESPTGTGKTLCLLCSTLAWQREQAKFISRNVKDSFLLSERKFKSSNPRPLSMLHKPLESKIPIIIYASRTHSQLTQVINELHNVRYRPRHTVLGSREQLCVNPNVRIDNSTAFEINHKCNRLTRDRKCRYRNNLDIVGGPNNGEHYGGNKSNFQPIMDIEELVTLGKNRHICPFFLTRRQISDAEIIFVPYNYLFDKEARTVSLAGVQWENSIIIFDEAHNLESFASDSASFDLSGLDISGCIKEITCAVSTLRSFPDLIPASGTHCDLDVDKLISLKSLLLKFEHYLEKEIPENGVSYTGEYIFEIFQRGANITYANHGIFLNFVRQVTEMMTEIRGRESASGTPKLDHIIGCIKKIFGMSTEGQCIARARAYRVHISKLISRNRSQLKTSFGGSNGNIFVPNANSGRVLSYWCFAPSLAMNEIANLKVRSILITSGTLSPLPSYSLELGLAFPHTVENLHIISKDQINVRLISKGASGNILSSAYDRRNNIDYLMELVNTIISLVRVIPGGVLIFFPSYGVMENCIEQWGGPLYSRSCGNTKFRYRKNITFFQAKKRNNSNTSKFSKGNYCFQYEPNISNQRRTKITPWMRLLAIKYITLEPKSTTDLNFVITEYYKYINLPKSPGCIMMGVCRGKISEGIDFSDDKCRAVIITGIPFAPHLDPKVKLKREYLDGLRISKNIKPSGEGGFGTNFTQSSSMTRDDQITVNKFREKSLSLLSLSGSEWYLQQAHRAVNQAIGRVIRHKSDYGSVILLDSRFNEPRNQAGLSKWIRPYIVVDTNFGSAISSTVKFYRSAGHNANAHKEAFEGVSAGSYVTDIDSKYDGADEHNDTYDDNQMKTDKLLTKITLIKASNRSERINGLKPQSVFDHSSICARNSDDSVEDCDIEPGYIKPDRVIKRIKLNDIEKKNNLCKSDKKSDIITSSGNSATRFGLADIYNSHSFLLKNSYKGSSFPHYLREKILRQTIGNDSNSNKTTSVWSCLNVSDDNSSSYDHYQKYGDKAMINKKYGDNPLAIEPLSKISLQKKFPVQNFYELAKNILTDIELIKVQRFLLSMKSFEDLRDSKSYLLSAHALVEFLLLSKYNISTNSKFNSQVIIALLELLYPLLPLTHRDKVEEYACIMRFNVSLFNHNCRAILSSNDYDILSRIFPQIMGSDSRTNMMSLSEDIKDLMTLLFKKYIYNDEETLLLSMYYLIPSYRKTEFKKIVYNVISLGKVRKVDKKNKIEDINLPKFIQIYDISNPHDIKGEINFSQRNEQTENKLPTIRPSIPLHKSRISPLISCSKVCFVNEGKTSKKFDFLHQCLQDAKAETYIKATPHNIRINKLVKQNIPKGMKCIICNTMPELPLMGLCNHLACLNCWLQWLKRSKTCPQCRTATKVEDLEKVVFVYDAISGTPIQSLTQIFTN